MRFKSAIKKMKEGETMVCCLIQLKNVAFLSNTVELRNASLHREFPARINLSLFFSFAKIYKTSISW